MNSQNKEFSILKWILFPAISCTFAGVVAYFNIDLFGKDGVSYVAIVVLIASFSIMIVKYPESENRVLAIAAFVCEIVLLLSLIANVSYSVYVQRKIAVARENTKAQTENLEKISKLRGSKAQREAIAKLGEIKNEQQAFEDYERVLFWIMVGELVLFGASAFTLFGIANLKRGNVSQVSNEVKKTYEGQSSNINKLRTPVESVNASHSIQNATERTSPIRSLEDKSQAERMKSGNSQLR